jgi:hypothetical protein
MPSASDMDDLMLLTAQQAAALLGVDPKTLRRWGPPYVQMPGGARRFRRSALRVWIEQHQQEGTSAAVVAAAVSRSRARARNAWSGWKAVARGRSNSASTVLDFAEVAGLRPRKPPAP